MQEQLRALWQAPERFKPRRSNRDITEEAARTFAGTAERLRAAGVPAEAVSHFLTQCLFCFFAEDVGLLPERLFERLVGVHVSPERLRAQLSTLFETMRDGGLFGVDDIAWFNGGLFNTIDVPPLAVGDVAALKAASALNWSAIDPSIFGTLFERGLDPAKRSQLGAHFTDPATILRLVEPVVQRPLLAEWAVQRNAVEAALARSKRHGDKAWRDAQAAFVGFLERLRNYRVLDPACGSGNFLVPRAEVPEGHRAPVNLEAEALGLERQHDVTGPHNVLGIEINEYAAELARVTVWIGELQWRIQRGYGFKLNPVLEPLDHIECRDALLGFAAERIVPNGGTPSPSLPRQAGEVPSMMIEAEWPRADAVVGNPPFVGDKKMRGELGAEYTEQLRATFKGRVPGGADLVCYWFEKARAQIEAGALQRAGLVATNSIRGGRNREVLDRVCETTRIFEAWSDEAWINEGAAVRVSLVAFGKSPQAPRLDAGEVGMVYADLTAAEQFTANLDLALAERINTSGTAFIGTQKGGPFDVSAATAREWLTQPNPHRLSNAEVLFPWINGLDITRRPQGMWLIDFDTRPAEDAALYERPWAHCNEHVRPKRLGNREMRTGDAWWLLQRARPEMKTAMRALPRYIATARVAKHRLFAFVSHAIVPDSQVVVFARADNTAFGLLHSRFHELWSLRMCTWMGKGNDPRYTPTTCFETFPFPAGLTPADTAHRRTEPLPDGAQMPADLAPEVRPHAEAIARAAKHLCDLRDAWLNPPEWTERVPEVVPLGMQLSADGEWYVRAPATPSGIEPEAESARDALRSPQAGPLFRALRAYPDRIVAKPGFEKELAKRTLTNLYNQRPAWLAQAHEALDAAVAVAYGWVDYTSAMSDDEILRRLLALNLARAGKA